MSGKRAVIVARGLEKSFGEVTAVDGIDFEVCEGECFGILGPNGAGKTSTLRMLYDFSPRGGGELSVFGLDPSREGSRVRQVLGVVQQKDNLDQELTVRENLEVYAGYYGIDFHTLAGRLDELLAFMELEGRGGAQIRELSGGMQRRLTILRALVHYPRLVILDEPTTGLDPQARHQIWAVLRKLTSGGVTVILTTHYMDEAERLCDRLVIMDKGRILHEGAPRELIKRHLSRLVLEVDHKDLRETWRECGLEHESYGDRVFFNAGGEEAFSAVPYREGVLPGALRPSDLEDVFLKLTGRRLDDA
ncbi:MAG: ABC transporter ATP-binding protein [Candidatus Glassbacteria bacterium]|nr:ABC transporter ATP-binding protein [Candidatus Glassbacteria bacterium]